MTCGEGFYGLGTTCSQRRHCPLAIRTFGGGREAGILGRAKEKPVGQSIDRRNARIMSKERKISEKDTQQILESTLAYAFIQKRKKVTIDAKN
jgi:hypothetical protein